MLLELLGSKLGLPLDYLEKLARSSRYQYRRYEIPKRTGGTRVIDQPSRRLKAIQYQLKLSFLDKWLVHPAATAYLPHRSILENALPHSLNNYLLRLDLQDFFPSLLVKHLEIYVLRNPGKFQGFEAQDLKWFGKYLFRDSRLTIGAPTSPALSNALCYELDQYLATFCSVRGIAYTRYADDLFFSTSEPNVLGKVEPELVSLIEVASLPSGLKVNRSKTTHSSKRGRRRITGLTVGSDSKIHVGRLRKRAVRSQVHELNSLSPVQRQKLAGQIAYVRSIEPDFVNSLVLKYGASTFERARRGFDVPDAPVVPASLVKRANIF